MNTPVMAFLAAALAAAPGARGLEAAPSALVDLYSGDNRGKLLVKIADR